MKMYRQKKIWTDKKKGKYCIVKLFKTKIDMQNAYKDRCPSDTQHYRCLGAHNAYEKVKVESDGEMTTMNETGTVFLNLEFCGAGIVSHELMHAVLWAHGHKKNKKQYPIVIKNMKQEEAILQNHTIAVIDFYKWYWKIEKQFK
jgi:hypothetical protein